MEANSSGYPWSSLDSPPQPYNDHTRGFFDPGLGNDTSLCWSPDQENSDAWLDTSETLDLAFMGFSPWNDLTDHDQCQSSSPSNETWNNLGNGDLITDLFSEFQSFAPSEASSAYPETLSTESPDLTFWESFSSQSPSSAVLFSEPISVSPTPSILLMTPGLSIGELLGPTSDLIQSIGFPEVEPIPGSRAPEQRPSDNTPSPQNHAPHVKMRERRKKDLPEKCEVCERGHQFRSLKERHIRAKHPNYVQVLGIAKPRSICKICHRSFARSDHLHRHGQSKHGWPPRKKKS